MGYRKGGVGRERRRGFSRPISAAAENPMAKWGGPWAGWGHFHFSATESRTWRSSDFPRIPDKWAGRKARAQATASHVSPTPPWHISSSSIGRGFVATPKSIIAGPIADVAPFGARMGSISGRSPRFLGRTAALATHAFRTIGPRLYGGVRIPMSINRIGELALFALLPEYQMAGVGFLRRFLEGRGRGGEDPPSGRARQSLNATHRANSWMLEVARFSMFPHLPYVANDVLCFYALYSLSLYCM